MVPYSTTWPGRPGEALLKGQIRKLAPRSLPRMCQQRHLVVAWHSCHSRAMLSVSPPWFVEHLVSKYYGPGAGRPATEKEGRPRRSGDVGAAVLKCQGAV
jgi:hypothetical protein